LSTPSSCLLQTIALIVGYILQDITLALYIGLGGTALAFIVIVPPWPFYNRYPVKWVPVARSGIVSQGIMVDGKVVA
jgi:signal peptidase complex subunit 1